MEVVPFVLDLYTYYYCAKDDVSKTTTPLCEPKTEVEVTQDDKCNGSSPNIAVVEKQKVEFQNYLYFFAFVGS